MRRILLFLLVIFTGMVFAQKEGPLSVSLNPKTGFLMAHRETMHHLVKDRSNVVELEFSRQDNSNNVWSKLLKYPSKGTALVFQDYGNPDVLGVSFTVFRFTKFPIVQSEKWGFVDFRLGQGISYITKKYDPFVNKKNIAIGSHINGYVNLQFAYTKYFEQFHIGTGFDFAHISNAKLKTPNQGLNSLTGFVTIGYNVDKRNVYSSSKYVPEKLEEVRKFNKWQFHFIFGLKQNLPDHFEARNFGVAGLQGLYRKNLGPLWDAEFGLDLVYNEANRWLNDIQPRPAYEAFLLGGYSGMALSLYRSQVYFGLGVYALNPIDPAGWVYNRAGLRMNMNENWNFSIGIKAHVGIADHLEWGLGYRF